MPDARGFRLSILEGNVTVVTDTLRLAAGAPDEPGVMNGAVAANVRSDREVVDGAKHGSVVRHLILKLPHAENTLGD
jgi:hypothetical protein